MSEPALTFRYNHSSYDTPFDKYASPDLNYRTITPSSDLIVFTGGGIDDVDKGMGSSTLAAGIRSSTIRPSSSSFVIPYTYVEDATTMYRVPLAGHNVNRYVFCVSISGTMNSDLYLEAWDTNSFSEPNVLPVLSGTANSSYESYVNAIRTTQSEPPWHPGWSGSDTGVAAYLRGTSDRVGLNNSSVITNSDVYFNIYIRLQTDCGTFHNTPALGFRYLYT
jgi:hypothetical protein